MGRLQVALVFAGALLAVSYALPLADADHCASRVHAFGRAGIIPTPPPPHSFRTMSLCSTSEGNEVVDAHEFPPATDQVMVRLAGDYNKGTPTLSAVLDGLGFESQTFTLHRVLAEDGLHCYELLEWVPLPQGPQEGTLRVTINTLDGPRSSTYTSAGLDLL